jgi:hypothetical protein
VRVRLSDQALIDDVKAYLEAAECSARVVGEVTLDVAMPRAPTDAQALREIAIYLKTWQAMNPNVHARIVGEGEGSTHLGRRTTTATASDPVLYPGPAAFTLAPSRLGRTLISSITSIRSRIRTLLRVETVG